MQRILWSLLVLALMLSACVPNKNYVYLQKNDVNKKNLPTDSVVRTYDMQIVEYRIQPLDILSVRLESLTEDEFDFMSKLNPTPQGGGNAAANPALSGFLVDNIGEIEFPVVGR